MRRGCCEMFGFQTELNSSSLCACPWQGSCWSFRSLPTQPFCDSVSKATDTWWDAQNKAAEMDWSGSVHRLLVPLKYTQSPVDSQILNKAVSAFSQLAVKYLWPNWHEKALLLLWKRKTELKSRVAFPYNDFFIGKKFARKYSWKSWISLPLIRDHNTRNEEGEEHCGSLTIWFCIKLSY